MSDRTTLRRIVIGVDGSDSSKAAFRWAAQQAALTCAELRPVQARRLGPPTACRRTIRMPTSKGTPARTCDAQWRKCWGSTRT
ncbi:universal stress protein [Streptomyces sp. NBC_00996]|uniref:universal stress protein n=1 Tax=Streptomyces sp. NBC_00996 TaxID=2903710 RepID=UPI003870D84D|nr:universal stress protein [Streptomyces sp. NBC_00996]